MKLPFDFGIRFVLRLLLPGVILASAFFPIATRVSPLLWPGLRPDVLFLALGMILGLSLLLLDMPIYMVFEGRRFWPRALRNLGLAWQQWRLARLRKKSACESDSSAKVELDLRAWQYPLDATTAQPMALYPTRLGNLLASFETYPTIKYGLDGVFFWPRLWVAIGKDLRDELDTAQAIVDGAIYGAFSFLVWAVLAALYAFALHGAFDWRWLAASGSFVVLSYLFYRAALPSYAQYGQLFEATFDQYRDQLKFGALVDDLDEHMADARAPGRSEREDARVVWRFLRWHRYRPSRSPTNEPVRNWLK